MERLDDTEQNEIQRDQLPSDSCFSCSDPIQLEQQEIENISMCGERFEHEKKINSYKLIL